MTTADAIAAADAGAALLALSLTDDSRAAVAANLAILMERAAEFVDLPLEPAADPAGLLRL